MKGLNNHDVMQSALCTFIYASSPPNLSGDRQGFVRSAAGSRFRMPGFLCKGFKILAFSFTPRGSKCLLDASPCSKCIVTFYQRLMLKNGGRCG